MSLYNSFSITYLLCIILILTVQSLSSVPLRTQQSEESFIKNTEEFVPTNEWQTVKEGQAIPPGLHIRLNLQSGLREAKLLENSKQEPSSNDLVLIPTDPDNEHERISKENLQRAFSNLDFSKDDVVTDEKHVEDVKRKFRPYDELKKDLESMNMKIETDHEILTKLIKQLGKTDNEENRKTILTDLEFYLHQYDNAIVFGDMHGLELLIQLLNTTDTSNDNRYLASLALGAAFQGNPKVQSKGLNLGLVRYLLHLLNSGNDNTLKYRLVFTLSTLLRNFPQAQGSFLAHGGIETIVKIVDSTDSNNKMKLRVIQLMNDLIIEKDQATDDKRLVYENIDIRDQLVKHNWCSYISHHLISIDLNEYDQIEKILAALIPLADACRNDFVSLIPVIDKLNDIYGNQNLNEYSTYMDFLSNLQNLRRILLQTSATDL
ncbi:unnamed protein product [Rotaria socialis]|uniref:Nucleotide exchange factor SIL1 n=1 Tax=Rotaria socialis TaxID=392032 RepID=A0A818UYB2_9BILA|nr:unnamed protein product [Rotaria socialis]